MLAQSNVSLIKSVCPGTDTTKVRVLVFVPVGSLSFPVCATLGSGLVLTNTSTGPVLSVSVPVTQAVAAVLAPQAETINLDPATVPLGQVTLNYALAKPPVAGTFVTVIFKSSIFPADVIDMVPAAGQNLVIALPTVTRSQTAGDSIQVRYFSN
jgi:hypothetical protein